MDNSQVKHEYKNIEIDSRCSFCEKDLWSYRREGKKQEGVKAGIAAFKLIL